MNSLKLDQLNKEEQGIIEFYRKLDMNTKKEFTMAIDEVKKQQEAARNEEYLQQLSLEDRRKIEDGEKLFADATASNVNPFINPYAKI